MHYITLFFAKNIAELSIIIALSICIFLYSSFVLAPSKEIELVDEPELDKLEADFFGNGEFRADTFETRGKNLVLSAQEIIFQIQSNVSQANLVPIPVSHAVSKKTIPSLVAPPAVIHQAETAQATHGSKKSAKSVKDGIHSVQRVTRRLARL